MAGKMNQALEAQLEEALIEFMFELESKYGAKVGPVDFLANLAYATGRAFGLVFAEEGLDEEDISEDVLARKLSQGFHQRGY